jgi:gliding motility-associated lipoprotein GldD
MKRKCKGVTKNPGILLILALFILIIALAGCKKSYTPKPRSYFRIDFPEKKYIPYETDCHYSFDVPVYARMVPYRGSNPEPCWVNMEFPGYKGIIHITYKTLHGNLNLHVEDIRTLAYKHIIKADDIIERPFSFPDRQVHGMIFDIKGNTASSLSFYATDSSDNFLSGALYFSVIPNKDSLAPVINFFSADLEHLIETLQWK